MLYHSSFDIFSLTIEVCKIQSDRQDFRNGEFLLTEFQSGKSFIKTNYIFIIFAFY